MKRVLLIALALGLSACTGAGSFDTGRTFSNSNRSSFAQLAGGRDLNTIVTGNPFGVDQATLATAVTQTFNARNSRARSNFTTDPGPSARSGVALVVHFNAAQRILSSQLCTDPGGAPTTPGLRPIVMDIVFCEGTKAISGRRGTLPDAAGPTDPVFQDFLALGLILAQPDGRFRNDD